MNSKDPKTKDVIVELIENLVYDGVYRHHAELEENGEWQELQQEIRQIVRTLKHSVLRDQERLLDELLDKVVYMVNLAELNAYRFGVFDGAKLLNLLTSGEILRCGDS